LGKTVIFQQFLFGFNAPKDPKDKELFAYTSLKQDLMIFKSDQKYTTRKYWSLSI